MQTRVYLMLGTVSAALAVGASLWFTATSPDTPSVPSTATVAGGQTTALPPSSAAEPADTASVAGLPDPAAVRAYEARQVFHDQYRQFMATADQLLASQRDEQAATRLENNGWTVLRIRHDDDWPAVVGKHDWVFGPGRTPA